MACDMPEDLLELIFKQPSFDSFDLLTCLYVSVSWRSVAKRIINCCSEKSFLLLVSELFFPDRRCSSTEPYRINLPMTFNGRKFMSSCRGWILSSALDAEDEFFNDDLQLFNPSTRAIVKLPRPPNEFSKSPFRFILSTSPVNPNCRLLLFDMNLKRSASWKPGSRVWNSQYHSFSVNDIIYLRDRYGNTDSRRTVGSYTVESSSGDVLTITRFMQWGTPSPDQMDSYKTIGFEVHWYNTKTKASEEVTSLGNQAVFLQLFDSRCVLVHDPEICRPNCIYFVDDSTEGYYTSRGTDFGVFDMESKTIQQFDGPPFNRWFMPEP